MARSRFCRICKDFHDLEEAWPQECYGHFGIRGQDPGFYVRTDGMDAIENPVNGRLYDSKSAYYRAVKEAGCEIVGNEKPRPQERRLPPVGPDLKRALEQLRQR